MSSIERPPAIVRWTLRLEETTALDRPVRALEPSIRSVFGSGTRASVLRGDWLGHAVHPLLTDVVLGTWTSATVLDLFGGRGSSAAAQRLVGTGLLAVGPTAWTGWAEWSAAGVAREAGGPRPRGDQRRRDQRLRGVVGRPQEGPAWHRGAACSCRSGRLRSRRLPGRTPHRGTQGGQPPSRLRRRSLRDSGG